jgi:aryl sulfotransferase
LVVSGHAAVRETSATISAIVEAQTRSIEREYRSVVSDNRRWDGFVGRPGDIFVCTPPKCGTTWMQTIVMALVFQHGNAPGPVFEAAPWIDARFEPIDVVLARLDAQDHRRQIKTHTPADGIPWSPDASYIVVSRDGRDAFMSFHNHMSNMRPETFIELAGSAVADGIDLGMPPPVDDIHKFYEFWLDQRIWVDHVATFWAHRGEPNVFFAHYDDMKEDLDREMRRVAEFLEIEVDEERWPAVVESCTFAGMKARSAEIADFDSHFVGGADTFLYKGTNGRWRDVLTPEELAAFDEVCQEALPADCIAWVNRGA